MRRPALLSGDPPGHWLLTVLLLAVLLALACAPFVFPGTRALATAARVCIFIVLACSYDLLLGYAGIVSFAHTLFFGIGAYAVAIALARGNAGWGVLALGTGAGVLLAATLAGAIALLSLRVKDIFFAMITLALAAFAQVLASQWRDLTGGEDGLTYSVPELLAPAHRLLAQPLRGVRIDGRILTYYLIFAVALALVLVLLRLVNSPFGLVLQGIRENAFRAAALGYPVVLYRALASAIAAAIAAVAGVMMALLLRYTGPDSVLSFAMMMDVLLMVVIGGAGTLYGPVLGAVLLVLAQNYLQPLLQAAVALPLLGRVLNPDRWLLWLGVLFIAVVMFAPAGIAGTLRQRRLNRSSHVIASLYRRP
jgi:branched-chain amino acid transport system permease protein